MTSPKPPSDIHPRHLVAPAIAVAVLGMIAVSWLGWARREPSLETRTRDRLR